MRASSDSDRWDCIVESILLELALKEDIEESISSRWSHDSSRSTLAFRFCCAAATASSLIFVCGVTGRTARRSRNALDEGSSISFGSICCFTSTVFNALRGFGLFRSGHRECSRLSSSFFEVSMRSS